MAAPTKVMSAAEVAQHSQRDDIYMIIHGKVYNVTSFLDEHPGGEEVLLESAGADGTEGFEDVGHSDDARELLQKYYVADLGAGGEAAINAKVNNQPAKPLRESSSSSSSSSAAKSSSSSSSSSGLLGLVAPLAALVVAAVAYQYFKQH
ncbi:hypothetical protein RI367_007472 [Sorochytrium milnesiophthora]